MDIDYNKHYAEDTRGARPRPRRGSRRRPRGTSSACRLMLQMIFSYPTTWGTDGYGKGGAPRPSNGGRVVRRHVRRREPTMGVSLWSPRSSARAGEGRIVLQRATSVGLNRRWARRAWGGGRGVIFGGTLPRGPAGRARGPREGVMAVFGAARHAGQVGDASWASSQFNGSTGLLLAMSTHPRNSSCFLGVTRPGPLSCRAGHPVGLFFVTPRRVLVRAATRITRLRGLPWHGHSGTTPRRGGAAGSQTP